MGASSAGIAGPLNLIPDTSSIIISLVQDPCRIDIDVISGQDDCGAKIDIYPLYIPLPTSVDDESILWYGKCVSHKCYGAIRSPGSIVPGTVKLPV
jgi:hypothetical protein